MKKIFLLITLLIICIPVFAKDNKLYFTESGDRLYYDSKLFDIKRFMHHVDMVPGSSYVDELLIENGTNTSYTLYFKVVPRVQSKEADELLENILMKITLDGEIIYEGKATGNDYSKNGVDLKNTMKIGLYTPSKESKMVVETKLSETYSNTNLKELSYIDWSFYGEYIGDPSENPNDDKEDPNKDKEENEERPPQEIIENPQTGVDDFLWIGISIIVIALALLAGTTYIEKKRTI